MGTPHSRTSSSSNKTSPSEAGSVEAFGYGTTDTRVDPPHGIARPSIEASSASPSPEVAAAASTDYDGPLLEVDENDEFDGSAVESLRNQARQLSLLLSDRQEALDRREREWSRQLAQHETEVRSTRLWFDQRQTELDERETGLAAREQELEARYAQQRDAASALEVLRTEADAAAALRQAELDAREAELDDRAAQTAWESAEQRNAAQEVEKRRRDLDAQLAEIERADAEVRRKYESIDQRRAEIEQLAEQPSEYQLRMQDELDEREAALDRRETESVTVELRVRQALIEVERLQAELYEERDRLAAQQKHDSLELAEQRRRVEHETAEKQRMLERQNEQLDFRRAAVRQEQADLAESQRETLEMRLVVEELWSQLSGIVPPAVLSENTARLRNRLGEQYRLQQNEIAAQRAELEGLRADLAAENDKLRNQTVELRRWAEARHDEIERQASFLAAREQELERQDAEMAQRSQTWRQERGRMELELRRLEGELRRVGIDATAPLHSAFVR